MIAGYEPNRVANLRWHTALSIDGLRRFTSSDPAADSALVAIRRLQRALEIDLMSALDALADRDPLTPDAAPRHLLLPALASARDDARRQSWERRYTRWQQFDEYTVFELEMFLRIEFTRQAEASSGDEAAATFWAGRGAPLIVEFEQRARNDDAFEVWLVEQAAINPLIGVIVANGDFDDATVLAVTTTIISAEPLGVERDMFRADAITALLETITERPALALDLLSDADATRALFAWNTDAFHATHLADDLLGDLVVNGLVVAPMLDGALLEAAYRAIATFVSMSSDTTFETGFTPPVAAALSLAIAAHAPIFLDSSSSYCRFDVHDGFVAVPLGDRDDLVAFFATLMHDPVARALLTAAIHDLAASAVPAGPEITPEQVSAFSVLLDEALDQANLDLAERSAVVVSLIGFGTTISNFVAGQVLNWTGVGALGKFLVSFGIKRLGAEAADRVQSDSIEAPDFAVLGDIIIELELLRSALGPGAVLRPAASEMHLATALDALDAVDALFSNGPASFADIERAMRELRRTARLVVEPPQFTRFVARDLETTTHPCDEGHLVPPYAPEG